MAKRKNPSPGRTPEGFHVPETRAGEPRPGFQMSFANGYVVSVMWSENNYAGARGESHSPTAEIGVWNNEGWVNLSGNPIEPVLGWSTADEAAQVIAFVSTLSPSTSHTEAARLWEDRGGRKSNPTPTPAATAVPPATATDLTNRLKF